jgi:Ca2+-binding RTX toxin-like protein
VRVGPKLMGEVRVGRLEQRFREPVYTDNDFINGFGGNNALYGGADNDALGGSGIDQMFGGSGDDIYYVNNAADSVNEDADAGTDIVIAEAGSYTLGTNVENLTLSSGAGVSGTGNALDNAIVGGAGGDTLTGGAGSDRVRGNAGADRFVFASPADFAADANRDLILDFSSAQGDRIDLSGIDAVGGGADDAFSFIGTAAFGNVAGQLRYEVSGADLIVFGDLDGNGAADFSFGLLANGSLGAGDFML